MSQWGTLEADFYGSPSFLSIAEVKQGMPLGSESEWDDKEGPYDPNGLRIPCSCTIWETKANPKDYSSDERRVHVHARLRDVNDSDSPAVLAWWVKVCADWGTRGTLVWDLDYGPKYRYLYNKGKVIRERGLLE